MSCGCAVRPLPRCLLGSSSSLPQPGRACRAKAAAAQSRCPIFVKKHVWDQNQQVLKALAPGAAVHSADQPEEVSGIAAATTLRWVALYPRHMGCRPPAAATCAPTLPGLAGQGDAAQAWCSCFTFQQCLLAGGCRTCRGSRFGAVWCGPADARGARRAEDPEPLKLLKRQLAVAIGEEDYRQAARLRDHPYMALHLEAMRMRLAGRPQARPCGRASVLWEMNPLPVKQAVSSRASSKRDEHRGAPVQSQD